MTHFISLLVFEYVFPNKTGSTGGSQSHLPSLILALISPVSSLSALSSAIYCHTWRGGAPNFSPWLESLPLARSFSKPSVGLRPRFKTLIAPLMTVLIVSDSVFRVPLEKSQRAEVCLFLCISVHGNNVSFDAKKTISAMKTSLYNAVAFERTLLRPFTRATDLIFVYSSVFMSVLARPYIKAH